MHGSIRIFYFIFFIPYALLAYLLLPNKICQVFHEDANSKHSGTEKLLGVLETKEEKCKKESVENYLVLREPG